MCRIIIFFLFSLNMVVGLAQEEVSKDSSRISLLFIGDVMQHDSQIHAAYDTASKQYDYKPCFQYVKPIIQKSDIAFANLEVTFGGKPYKGYPQFSAPDELAMALKDAGVDCLVTANNHSYDRGKKGMERTLRLLEGLNFKSTGTFKDSLDRVRRNPLFMEKNGFKIALLNYSYGTNGIKVLYPNIVNAIDTVDIKTDLKKAADSISDIIIVFMHWGKEYERNPNSTQKMLADFCFNHGANLVIGSHPHVIQKMEKFEIDSNEVFVSYSMGNYVSNQRKRYTDGGVMVQLELKKDSDFMNTRKVLIEEAGYYLTWVYPEKDSLGKEFYILPASQFKGDTSLLVKEIDRNKMDLFARDSRQLLRKNNKDVSEYIYDTLIAGWVLNTINYKIQDQQCKFKIQFLASKEESHKPLPGFDESITIEKTDMKIYRHMLGCFENEELALEILNRLRKNTKYKDAFVVEYKHGKRVQKKAGK